MSKSRVVAVTAVVTIVVTLLLFATWVFSGLYNPAATGGAGGLVDHALEALTDRSITARARLLPPPPALDPEALTAGAERYHALCVGCHSAPGVPRDIIGEGLVPQAPDLSRVDRTEAELYWVIRNGIRNRGMPAYHQALSDEQQWAIAKFAKRTAGMSAAEYESIFMGIMNPASPAAPEHVH